MEAKKTKNHMRRNRIIAGIVIFLVLMYYPALLFFSHFLAKTERVKANTLVIEGWLQVSSLKQACAEFKRNHYDYIITTGNMVPDEYELDQNGYLIFYPKCPDSTDQRVKIHHLGVKAYSSLPGRDAAHFNFWVNDSLITGFKTEKRVRTYEIVWKGAISELDSVLIQFDNDKSSYGDRNLFVTGLFIDNTSFRPYSLKADYDISRLDGIRREERNSDSYAGQARSELIRLGIEPEKIISVPGYKTNLNRTYHSVVALQNWLDHSGYKIKGINVVSYGVHSRRTWLTYKKVLDHQRRIGIIALPDVYHKLPEWSAVFFVSKQIAAYLYYKFILLPLQSLTHGEHHGS